MASKDGVRDLFAPPRVLAADGGEPGELLLRSAGELGAYPVTVVHSLREWAAIAPEHPLISERDRGDWRTVSYGRAVAAADAIGQALLERGLGPGRPLLVLSGNGVDHLLVTLGAMTAGIPVAPVSVAYSLQSRDHARIREIAGLISPGAVFAADAAAFAAALDALPGIPPVVSAGHRDGAEHVSVLMNTRPGDAVRTAFDGLSPDGTAKILFTSGSTGAPKGVLNTHRMLAANQRMIRQAWPFLGGERPVIVDWLPWSHTFGGNHNLNMMISSGGTLFVDAGRPVPALFGQTIRNLTDVPPTIYFNVPAGYAQLVPALEADPEFAAGFFSRLRLLFNAGDAVALANPADPSAGLVFRGWIAEDFKLASGTFVRVGAVRTTLLSAIPVLSDAVLAGENKDCVASPASLDAGEITDDKGYINQHRVLACRADLVDMLYADPVPAGVVVAERTS